MKRASFIGSVGGLGFGVGFGLGEMAAAVGVDEEEEDATWGKFLASRAWAVAFLGIEAEAGSGPAQACEEG